MNVLIPRPAQTSEKPSASSTLPCQPVPSPCTKPCQIAAASLSFIPGLQLAAHVLHRGGADLVREPHALDLLRGLDRARGVRTGVASAASGHASNHAFVNVVGSPTMRSEACVPSESSSPTVP